MLEILQYEFMRNALMAAILVSIACGIVGTFVVIKKLVFISGGIAHGAFGGVGLGFFLNLNPVWTAIPFSMFSALAIGSVSKKTKISEDSAIGILWSVGMALGIFFIGLTPGYAPDLFGYLFGSILTVPMTDIILMFCLNLLIITAFFLFYKEFVAVSFDEEFSEIAGIKPRIFYYALLCMIALSIIMMIRVVGIILVIALLTIPTVTVKQFTNRLKSIMIYSTLTAIFLTTTGLYLSYLFELPSGATIVLLLALGFGLTATAKKIKCTNKILKSY